MKKVALCTVVYLLLITTIGFAGPQTDFTKGQRALDIGVVTPELTTGSTDWNKKANIDLGITRAFSDKFALEHKYQNMDSDDTDVFGSNGTAKSKTREINVLYKLNKTMVAFAGLQKVSGSLNFSDAETGIKSTSRAQIGVTGVKDIADKLKGWSTVAAGKDTFYCEVGLGYAIMKNADLNLFYRYKKINNLELEGVNNYNFDLRSKDIGLGMTVKF